MAEYAGRQFVGIDLHRRRSVIVRMTDTGQVLETTRIVNDADRLAAVLRRAGESPEVVLEATYGWYWAADVIAAEGARTHLAHPLGVKAFEYRRVKNDVRDAADLADLLRMGRLPEAWIAPPATRELRELVRHESDTKVRRGRITKQGSRLVRWAAVESVKALPTTTAVGQLRDRVAARRGPNIGAVAAARRQVEYVFYALRDHHVRALSRQPTHTQPAAAA
jgi:transposase